LVVAVHVSDSSRYSAVRMTWANCSHVPTDMGITFVFFTSIYISFSQFDCLSLAEWIEFLKAFFNMKIQ
jgi:hypothetical protein